VSGTARALRLLAGLGLSDPRRAGLVASLARPDASVLTRANDAVQ
jgi:hypothetical protein